MLAGALDQVDYWPSATHWAGLLLWRTEPHREVVITGEDQEAVKKALKELRKAFKPQVLWVGGYTEVLPLLQNRQVEELSIFVCEEGACQLPVNQVADALELLP